MFNVPTAGRVMLKVYDIAGKAVATLINKDMAAGSYETAFNAPQLASGVYLCRLSGNGFEATQKLILLR